MILKKYSKFLLALILILTVNQMKAQLSKTHYIPPLTSAEFGNANPEDQYFYISTPSLTDIAFTIKPVGLSSSGWIEGIVSNTSPQRIYIETGNGQLFVTSISTSQVINQRGYIIEASDLIYVSVRMNGGGGAQAGALVSKGLSALDTEFRVGALTNQAGRSSTNTGGENLLSFVSVMATEANTVVTFSDISNNTEIKNSTKTFPYSEILNKGDSYTIAMNSYSTTFPANNKDGLIGAFVKSDKPIAVICGSTNGSFHSGGGRDYGIDQIVGTSKIGTEYIFVKGDGENEWENVLIVAHEDNTAIYVNGNTTAEATINAGDYHLIEGNKFTDGNMYVETSKPVFAYQGVGATTNDANQGMFFVPPLDCETRGNVDKIAQIDKIGDTSYQGGVTIVTKVGATVSINGSPITQTSYPVDGKPNYITYKVLGLTGDISVQCDDELYCAYFNYNGSATSGSFYSGFPTAPEINFDADFVTLGNCIDNITLEAANMGAFESIEWYYDDGSGGGFIPTGVTTETLTPTFPSLSPFSTGTYKIVGITCKGDKIHSDEIPVSICPDDTDNDGIIDNIDIDNDNDGILNCAESYEDQIINLTNPINGSLPVGGYTYTGDITPIGDTSNNLIGASDGTFKSTVASKNGLVESSLNYDLLFNKDLNILVELADNSNLGNSVLTDEDEFVIKVTNDKTITLVDPDDQLLIDTDYDGVYESGITQFSSFQIHFKIKGASLADGAGTFRFASSMINSFTYNHKNISETSSNSTAFKITATCVPLDSDNDGNNDDFDNDSDNDGIPDIIEATGKLLILSGVDSDNNGLDDVFDISAIPIDTDIDGVLDYLDLDSDNDGIFDLEESGSLLPDTDFDGIIDNILTTIGLNGWDDNAETTPDSGEIGYTVRDTDANNLFNYINSDSDGDLCSDVIEAGFTPSPTNNNIINGTGVNPVNGLIIGSDGYNTTPNIDYITAAPITINQQPLDTEICQLDTTKITIETNAIDSYQWQVNTDGINWKDIDSIIDTNYQNETTYELTILESPLSYNNNKYRVVLEKVGNTCGLISNEVILTVNALPLVNIVDNLIECDNLEDTNDTNGIVQNFDLEGQTNDILGTQLPIDFSVTYHLTKGEADAGSGALTSPYTNISNPQTIYTRVENIATGCFVSTLTFDLIVNPLPIANTVKDLFECDDMTDGNDTNGVVQNFKLDEQTGDILGTQLPTDFTVTYHLSKDDAISGANPLTSPHSNTLSPDSQTIHVRILNNTTDCVNPHLTFNVVVNELPIANIVEDLQMCDNLDDNDDTNGVIQTWDLDSQTITILGTQPTTDYTVSYHLSVADAISGNTPLSSPHSNNSSPDSQTIYVRVLNITTGCINTHVAFDLIVHPLPIVTSPVTLKQCDDDTDGYSAFNLTEADDEISANAANENFTYYLTLAEAISRTNPIPNPTTFVNRTVNADIVWASIESQFGCTRETEIQLFVSTTGIPPSYHRDFYQCDDFLDENGDDNANNDKRDGIATFDFSSVDDEVRAIFPPGQAIIITYYRNEDDALAEQNAIQDISNYRNIGYPNSQDIYIRVDSELNNDCLGFGDHVTLTVEELPFANPVTIERQCDDDDDGMYPFDI